MDNSTINNTAIKILVVDDDIRITELISLYLKKEGYDTKEVNNGLKAVEVFSAYSPHLVLLDLMLPGMDGYQVCSAIRKISQTPIIMLTAKSETFDKVLGLELGADDYIVKPFDAKELMARVKAVLRRMNGTPDIADQQVVLPNLTINQTRYTAIYHSQKLDLPPKEFELLYFFASHPNRVFSREQLLDKIWGYDFYGGTRTVDVHVKRLREKMPYEDTWGIKTVWGVGYKFET
ncbi:MAG: response regulator transcription factor [Clostridiales bacterium]|jgi:DNA-binding response OmpR family regulator|nr:response regulator transcription factor [Clostridiales bacterium]